MNLPESLSLAEFVRLVKRELAESARNRQPEDLAFSLVNASVEVEVVLERADQAEGGLKMMVLEGSAGTTRTTGMSHKLTLQLQPDQEMLLGNPGAGSKSQLD